jgi:ADP-ribosylation factor-like protein 6
MPGLFQMIADAFGFSRKEAKILVIGLDNSGKTTLINHLKPKKVNIEEIK